MSYRMDWSVVVEKLPLLAKGLVFTVEIAVVAYILALIIGLLVALARMSTFWPVSVAAFVYTQFFRSISIYIYVLWVYFGLPILLGINFNPFVACVISLVLLNSAYIAEVYRSAIISTEPGQSEAAISLGLSRISTFVDIIMPQMMRVAIPPLIGQFASIIKDTSVVAVIGAGDLMYQTIIASSFELRYFEFYTVAAVIYLSMVLLVSGMGNAVERRLKVSRA